MKPAQHEPSAHERLLQLPDHLVGEIVAGQLHVMPRPAPPHANANMQLGTELVGPFQRGRGGPGGWVFFSEPELHLEVDDVLVPDLAGWRRESLPALPQTAYFGRRPEWVCEVLSPSTAAYDRGVKMPIYARAGVEHCWLVDPVLRTLEVYRLENGRWSQLQVWIGDAKVQAEPFQAIELDLALLWTI